MFVSNYLRNNLVSSACDGLFVCSSISKLNCMLICVCAGLSVNVCEMLAYTFIFAGYQFKQCICLCFWDFNESFEFLSLPLSLCFLGCGSEYSIMLIY